MKSHVATSCCLPTDDASSRRQKLSNSEKLDCFKDWIVPLKDVSNTVIKPSEKLRLQDFGVTNPIVCARVDEQVNENGINIDFSFF